MKEHAVNKLDNFLCGWYMTDHGLLDRVIDFHQGAKTLTEGRIMSNITGGPEVVPEVKTSFDSNLAENLPLLEEYFKQLQPVIDLYIKKYPQCNAYSPWNVTDAINVQHYPPGGAYFGWHTERTSKCEPATSRHLVFMTYLNDVKTDGETEFFHQKLKIRPEKGLTLIWPADWTFTHRGIAAPSEHKYIITSWFNFV